MRRRSYEQGYGQEERSEEEAGQVSAGEARREEGEETEPRRVSALEAWLAEVALALSISLAHGNRERAVGATRVPRYTP